MEQAEFKQIAARVRQKAMTTALAMSADGSEAEDIAQDTMLKMLAMLDAINDIHHAETLACRIARQKTIDCHRRHRTVPIDTGRAATLRLTPSPEAQMETQENDVWLARRLAELPQTEYMILRLRQVEHKTNGEIADLLGISKASVATLLRRARKKLFDEITKMNRHEHK